ncbi:MAG: cell envelope integrity protein TolA [Alphaproteobacteria bacterium]|nr:cell envelope integrity protein TolA [Alphaproteobacteria bacterium]
MRAHQDLLPIALIGSVVLHLLLMLAAVFGLPGVQLSRPEIQPTFVVDIELPRVAISNPPKAKGTPDAQESKAPITDQPPKTTPMPPPPPPPPPAKEEPKPEAPKPETVKPSAKQPEPEDEVESLKKLLAQKAEERKAREEKDKKKEEQKKKEEEVKKPEPPKPDQAKKPEPKKPDDPFADNILKTLSQKKPPPAPTKGEVDGVARVKGTAVHRDSLPVGFSDLDLIRKQIEPCWNVPAGARYAEDLVVTVEVELEPSGEVRSALITDRARLDRDPAFRTAAESARRAVWSCSPLKLPPEKYDDWKKITLTFDPKQVLGF